MWGAGYPVQASFVPGQAANPFVPAQHAWAQQQQQQQQGRFSYGAQQAVQAAYGQSLTYQPMQMLSSGTTTTKLAGEEKYIAFSEGNDTEEFVIQTLSGEFTVKGENHGRPFYQKMPVRAGTPPPEVFVYYWDGRDGPSFEGWWFGKAVGGNEVWSHCPEKAMLPPLKGWKIPFQGPARNTFVMMPRSEKQKRENQERAGRVKVLEQGASNVINAAQKAADEAKVVCEKDHGSLDPTILKEVEASLKPHLQALMDQLKNVESAGMGDATKQLESKIRRTHVQATDAISKIKVLVPQIMRVQQEKQSEQRDEKLLKEMLTSITEKFHAAEDLAEKAEITSAMIEHAGEDLVEAQKAAQQTEESAKQAAAAVKEALTAIGLKLAMLKQFESDQGRLKATDALGTFREKLRVANQKLVPFLAAQDTFKAQAEAKYLADELEAKLAPAEVEVDKAEQVAEPLLSFAEAALAAGQAAAEATATPKAKASSSKEKDKKSEKSKEKTALNQLPKAEVVAQAAQNAQEAAVSLQGVAKLLETKRSDQQVLFSAPMKKVLEKAENRVKNAQRKLERIKIAQKELKERETSIALVSDVQEKMESVEKALNLAKEAVAACQGDEQEMLKVATKEVSTAKVALSMRLLEVKRFTAEAGIQAQRSLQEHQQSLQASLAEIEALKKKAAENKEVSKRKEAQRKVEEAEDRAHQAEKSAADIFDESRIASMTAMEIREAGDKNQQAFKGTMEAVRAAQTMITTLQIEAKNKENAITLAHDYAKLQARLRQAEAAVAHCAVLPPAVQAQLQLKAQIDEVDSKVKDAEAKVEIAEKMAMEAEKNPLPPEEPKGDTKTGAGVAAPKAFPSKAMPYKGKAFGKGEPGKGEPEPIVGPVEKAKGAVEVANIELKMVMRYLEAQAKAEKIPEEDMNILKGRIEAAKTRVDGASGLLEKAVEKRASLALLGDADKKVFEAEKAVEAAAELAVPLQELMASEEKKPLKAQGGKKSEEQDGKEAEDKDEGEKDDEEKDAVKMDEKDKKEEEGKENKEQKEEKGEKETTDAQGQEKKGEDGENRKDVKGDEETKEEMKEEMKQEMKEEKEEKEPVKEDTEEDGEGKTEPSPLEEALAAMNNAAQVASRQLSSAKTTLAVKRISAKRLPGNAPATCLEQLDALQKRLDAAMKRLAEVRRGSTDRQYAKARKAMAQSIEQAEAKVEASKEAFQALMDLPEEADLPKMQQVLQSAAAAQSEATAAIQAARVPLVERLQKAKADGVTTDTSEVLKEFQEMFAKLAPLQSKLDEQRREANDKEHKFVASLLMQEATEMLKEVDGKLARLNEVAMPLTKGEELQPLARLGQLLEALRHHASSASKTHATLWGELAKASGGEGGHIIPKGITDALKSLQPELPDLADLLGATEEDAQMLAAGLARMDPEEAAKEDGGISEQKFIEHMKLRYLCVAVVTVTSELEVGSNTVRKLEVNEVLDALGEATRESKSGLERVECKAQQDGAQGFVTIAGSGGTTYLEVYTPFMERVRAAEEALADSHESVSTTVNYLKQKHDELKSTRGSQALNELKQKLQDLRVQATRAQVQYSDVKHKVTEAKNRHDRQLEAHKKRRQTAAEKLAADTITGEASAMVDELIAKATNACNAASSILNVTTSDTPSSTISLQALEQVEKDLLAVVEACAEGEGKIMKTVEKEIRNASKGPLVDARRMMFRLKVKLAPLPNNCKKHLKTIQEKKLMMVEDVQRMVADLLREHARKNNLSADALYEQLRKVPDHADGAINGNADANADANAEADGAIPIESLRGFLQSVKEMASAELDIALQGFEAGISRFAFFDLVEEYRKCVKEVAVTATSEVKSATSRKLEIDEVVQVLGQPTTEEGSGLLRAPCRILRDNIEGWVTLNGSQGTAYLKRVAKPYYLCEEETSLLDSCASSGQQVSTARKGERLEVLEGPRLETTTEVTRARGRATKDGQVGWVLFKDHSGRCFFELQDLLICRGGVALTDNFDIGACKAIRKLEVGETLQSLEEPRQDESRSLTRIKVRALNDGKEGWATSQGNQGTLYVVETNKHFTCAESVDLEASPGKALRRLEVGEGFELLQDPTVELRQGKRFARGRCSSGQPGEGWFAITGKVQPWTHREELSAKSLSTVVES